MFPNSDVLIKTITIDEIQFIHHSLDNISCPLAVVYMYNPVYMYKNKYKKSQKRTKKLKE